MTSLHTKCSAVPEKAPETGADEPVEKPPKKKKKKKKDLEPCESEGSTTEPAEFANVTMKDKTDLQVSNSVNGLWEGEAKKKKKKKKKHQEDQDQEPVFQGSDSSGVQSDHRKKNKKSKCEEAELTPLVEQAPKKKRENNFLLCVLNMIWFF